MEDNTTERIREIIVLRIRNLKILLLEFLTPLLRTEVRHAIKLHEEILNHQNMDPSLKDLDTSHSQVMQHWTKIYGDMITQAHLVTDIAMFQRFLTAKLLEDYTKEPCTINEWVLGQARVIEEKYAKAEDNGSTDSYYQLRVAFLLEEMMLNRDHIENKLRSAAQGHSGSGIRRLINRCDWSGLATTLTNDRDLALTLFDGRPYAPNTFNEGTRRKVLRGIDEIRDKYAREMMRGRVSNDTNRRSPPTPASSSAERSPEEPSRERNGLAWSILNMVTGGLIDTHSFSNANLDESTSLIKAE